MPVYEVKPENGDGRTSRQRIPRDEIRGAFDEDVPSFTPTKLQEFCGNTSYDIGSSDKPLELDPFFAQQMRSSNIILR